MAKKYQNKKEIEEKLIKYFKKKNDNTKPNSRPNRKDRG